MESSSPKFGKRGRTGMHGRHRRGHKVQRVSVACEVCGVVREYLPSQLTQRKRIRFCSMKCNGIGHSRAVNVRHPVYVTVRCRNCSEEFRRRSDQVKRSPNPCCSRICSARFRRRPFCKWPRKHVSTGLPSPGYDRQAFRVYHEAWRRQNKDRVTASARASRLRRRAAIKALTVLRKTKACGSATAQQVTARLEIVDGHCVYCGRSVDRLEIDHLEPLSKGGNGNIENLIPCCRWCNASKSNKDLVDWLYSRYGINGLCRAMLFLEEGMVPDFLFDNPNYDKYPPDREMREAHQLGPARNDPA